MAHPAHHSDKLNQPSPHLASAVLKRPPVPQECTELQGDLSISDLITLLKRKSEDSIERRLECAFVVRELWDRVNAGEMGVGVNWYAWARKNIKLGKTQLKGHMRVANADKPREEAERQFNLGWVRTERLAARFANETDMEKNARKNLQSFAAILYSPIQNAEHTYSDIYACSSRWESRPRGTAQISGGYEPGVGRCRLC